MPGWPRPGRPPRPRRSTPRPGPGRTVDASLGPPVELGGGRHRIGAKQGSLENRSNRAGIVPVVAPSSATRSEEHTSELQSLRHLVCRLLLEKKKNKTTRV